MKDIEVLIAKQKNTALSALFNVFGSSEKLGYSYSLADCDFFDSNRCYPEHWSNRPNIGAINPIPEYWYEEDRKIALEQIHDRKVIYKAQHWSSISANYIDKYQCGFFYMEIKTFKFYLAAFIFQLMNDTQGAGNYSDRFFNCFLDGYDRDERGWLASLKEDEVHVIIDFLIYLYMKGGDYSFVSKNCIDSFWAKGVVYGKAIVDDFDQEKMINDFIEKG